MDTFLPQRKSVTLVFIFYLLFIPCSFFGNVVIIFNSGTGTDVGVAYSAGTYPLAALNTSHNIIVKASNKLYYYESNGCGHSRGFRLCGTSYEADWGNIAISAKGMPSSGNNSDHSGLLFKKGDVKTTGSGTIDITAIERYGASGRLGIYTGLSETCSGVTYSCSASDNNNN